MTAIRELPTGLTIASIDTTLALLGVNIYEGAETDIAAARADTANWDSAWLQISEILSNANITKTMGAPSHGRISGDLGKPLADASGTVVFDDTNIAHWPHSVLCAIQDSNTLSVALPGMIITAPVALLEYGASHSFATHRRKCWWDEDANSGAGWYRPLRQADAVRGTPAIIQLLTVGATEFTAMVLPLDGQRLRLASEYELTPSDITAENAGVMPSGVAVDGQVSCGGIILSSGDATFNAIAGVVNWAGLNFAGIAQAGMVLQVLYEPYL